MKYLFLIVFVCCFSCGFSQVLTREVVNSAGSTQSKVGLTLINNIGETVIGTNSAQGFGLRQGFLQPDEVDSINVSIFHLGNLSICQGDSVVLFTSFDPSYTYQWTFNGNNIGGATDTFFIAKISGSYRVIVTDGSRTSISAERSVKVNQPPLVQILANRTKFCPGDSVQISATGANQYLWSTGVSNSNISIRFSGTYSVIGTDTNGCSSTSAPIQIAVLSPIIPNVNAIGPTSVCNSVVNLQSSIANSYHWSTGSTSNSIGVNRTGFYSVTTIDSNGCRASSAPIRVNVFTTVPIRPAGIFGDINPCPYVGNSTTATYSVAPDSNVLSYSWTVSNGMTIIGSNNGNSITVSYASGFTKGQIRVTPVNSCGNGLPFTIFPTIGPITTAPIVTQSMPFVCSILGTNTAATYSIQPIPGCSSYSWILPKDAKLVSGQGTTSIQVIYYSTFVSGNISVFGLFPCGNSPTTNIGINLLPKPVLTGSNVICPGTQNTYSTPLVQGALRYRFNLPLGLTFVSKNGNSVVVTNLGSFVSGTISVQVQTAQCGWTQPGTLTLSTTPCRSMSSNPNFAISIYPNPSIGNFKLNLGSVGTQIQYRLYSSDGRLVKQRFLGSIESETLNFEDLASGLYHIEITGLDPEYQKFRHVEKLMIER